MKTLEIDTGKTQGGDYFLDINGDRILQSEQLGEIVDRIEREILKEAGIKKKRRFLPWGK